MVFTYNKGLWIRLFEEKIGQQFFLSRFFYYLVLQSWCEHIYTIAQQDNFLESHFWLNRY